ncbi:unnamed protein product [Hermetia illucens]|uniref:Uncharacterized protein n=1 Tax=Hermetia illucens TaxID=343691 RepID=A0A7R8Z0B5_HERIL|nr:unnamed protein product [Hermetia illucens]
MSCPVYNLNKPNDIEETRAILQVDKDIDVTNEDLDEGSDTASENGGKEFLVDAGWAISLQFPTFLNNL